MCDAFGLNPFPSNPRSATDLLLRFIAYMSQVHNLRSSTMSGYVTHVRHMWHRSDLRRDPSEGSPLPGQFLGSLGKLDTRPPLFRRAFPAPWLTFAAGLSPDPVVRLAFSIGFLFFLRVSEYCTTDGDARLLSRHITIVNDCLVLDIVISKTDLLRRGSIHQRKAIPGHFLCPVASYQAYRASRPYNASEPALMCSDGRPFTADMLNALIKITAAHFGFLPLYFSSHSLRSGGATALHRAGAGVEILMREGRWASIESVFFYLRLDSVTAAAFSTTMLPAASSLPAPTHPSQHDSSFVPLPHPLITQPARRH
jgi:hypothetical protein